MMKGRPTAAIALLRGINVGGHNPIPMPQLRSLCADIGWAGVQSYIQSGNLVFTSTRTPEALEVELEQAIKRRFSLSIPVLVRTAAEWATYVKGNPFPDASRNEPKAVMLALSKAKPLANAVKELCERAARGETVAQVGDALWIHFAAGFAKSKLTPAVLDRLVGSPVTMRNWRTVLKLQEMAAQALQPH